MYEVGAGAEVRALHVMPGMEGPEGELHHHDYTVEVAVQRAELDERGMVCDLDVIDAALQDALRRVGGADLEVIRPNDAEAVTVEVFARWLHGELLDAVRRGGGETLTVKVWESPVAYGAYSATVT
jgi:6-pyruvoyltetrahydropterin/6-carboxytetrahydropterin synthase